MLCKSSWPPPWHSQLSPHCGDNLSQRAAIGRHPTTERRYRRPRPTVKPAHPFLSAPTPASLRPRDEGRSVDRAGRIWERPQMSVLAVVPKPRMVELGRTFDLPVPPTGTKDEQIVAQD